MTDDFLTVLCIIAFICIVAVLAVELAKFEDK